MPTNLPPGLYDLLLTHAKRQDVDRAQEVDGLIPYLEKLDGPEAPRYLTQHIGSLLFSALGVVGKSEDRLIAQLTLCNRIIDVIAEHVSGFSPDDYASNDLLTGLAENRSTAMGGPMLPPYPDIPLGASDLLVNDRQQTAIGHQLRTEIPSADRIDLIISFLKRSGLAVLQNVLIERLNAGVPVRVLTTSYMGATEPVVMETLKRMGAEIRVSYAQRTRLHAKAWLFHRNTGYSTAFIGSSNLSHSAQTLGLEWNVRLSAVETPHILEKFEAAFEGYWNAEDFEEYERRRFVQAITDYKAKADTPTKFFDIRPFPFQEEILEALRVAREFRDRRRNLIIAATGTGKTVIAALDYRNIAGSKESGRGRPSLLFIAHRQEILRQARDTFRTALRDGSFGEEYYAGKRPDKGEHVFASIQSLANLDLETLSPSAFDVVIVDEFHHAAAPTYKKILEHLDPKYLLGLTATPERSDGLNVQEFFGGEATAELRLWDAIDRGLLVPFQYFGLHDNVDLSHVRWNRGRYDSRELEKQYVDNRARVDLIVQGITDQMIDPTMMRALGFCVGVAHARFMADAFNELGIKSVALTADDSGEARGKAIKELAACEINIIFTVDLFNEGVDIPEVDTVLFLRPTESSTLFLQQLGRGLRLHEGKDCLTVLDFIGRARKEFRFDQRYRALTGQSRRRLQTEVERDFPHLPPGCAIQLDRQSRELVLDSVRSALQLTRKGLIAELVSYGPDITIAGFVRETGIEIEELYRGSRTWTDLRRGIQGWHVPPAGPEERKLERGLERILHIDDPERLDLYERLLSDSDESMSLGEREQRLLSMLLVTLMGPDSIGNIGNAYLLLRRHPAIVAELRELIPVLRDRMRHMPILYSTDQPIPLKVHCRYTRDEIMAAFDTKTDRGELIRPREGVYYHSATKSNLLFVTLRKSEREYSPTTMYRDYALSPSEFHWQSQSTTRPETERGERHTAHIDLGITPLLFVRETKKDDYNNTRPYIFLGPAELKSHEGERPMNIVWRMKYEMPGDVVRIARVG